MAFIGNPPLDRGIGLFSQDTFTGDGSTTTFDMSNVAPDGGDNDIQVFVDNVRQQAGASNAFTLGFDGSSELKRITFTTAPANSEQLWILYTHGSQELTIASQSAVNSNTWKITMSASPGSSAADYRRLLVHVDGAPRFFDRSDFTVSGNDIILK
mgnify:CR=1 FL=1